IELIKERNFSIAVDAVNSTGGIALPLLLQTLGVSQIEQYHCEPNGKFPRNPEPIPENLLDFSREIEKGNFDLGIVVDPDVDRLAFIQENGEPFGEEYTLVAVADYILENHPGGTTVSNLSSTRALKDITEKHGGTYHASAVGEVHVVEQMKKHQAVIGGEGNGGIIYPELHYGRDALVGIALFLTKLAKFGKSVSRLRASYPNYYISKQKIELTEDIDVDQLLAMIQEKYKRQPVNNVDGVKIEFDKEWVHLRKSNTEPIIRIYAESDTLATAEYLGSKIISDMKEIITNNQ
ncbi:MAG: phosphoglucosamine mutase, partial [Bacteroidetes bacterium]